MMKNQKIIQLRTKNLAPQVLLDLNMFNTIF